MGIYKTGEKLMKDFLGNNAQYIRYPFEVFLKTQQRLGVKEIDLTMQTPHIYIDSEAYESLDGMKSLLTFYGIHVYCVTPLPYRYTVCADEGSVQREKSEDYYKQCILAAESLGASYLCITGSGACYDYEPDRLRKNAVDTLKKLSAFAGQHSVTLLLGTVFGEECPNNASTPVLVHLDEIVQTLKAVASPYLKAYLDTEVISLCGETITGWFGALGENIRLVRFTDGNYNGYRLWGKGCLPCSKYIREIMANGYCGKWSLQIPGERYTEQPEAADGENFAYLKRCKYGDD